MSDASLSTKAAKTVRDAKMQKEEAITAWKLNLNTWPTAVTNWLPMMSTVATLLHDTTINCLF